MNVILLHACFLKTFIDIMLITLLFYAFTFLFTCIAFYSRLFYDVFSKL